MTEKDGPAQPERTHRWRFQQEVTPGVWVAACRACPRRSRPKRRFSSSKEVTQWWKDHQATAEHRRNVDPGVRQRRREESAWFAELGKTTEGTHDSDRLR